MRRLLEHSIYPKPISLRLFAALWIAIAIISGFALLSLFWRVPVYVQGFIVDVQESGGSYGGILAVSVPSRSVVQVSGTHPVTLVLSGQTLEGFVSDQSADIANTRLFSLISTFNLEKDSSVQLKTVTFRQEDGPAIDKQCALSGCEVRIKLGQAYLFDFIALSFGFL